jgi:hypothetical protein
MRAEMTRQTRLLLIGAGLCISLVPACNRHTAPEPPVPSPPIQLAGPPQPVTDPRTTGTPYPVVPLRPAPPVPPAPTPNSEPSPPPVATTQPRESAPEFQVQAVSEPVSEPKPAAQVTAARPAEDAPLVAALRCFLEKRPQDAVSWIQRYDKANQDLLLALLPLAAHLTERSIDRDKPEDVSQVIEQLQSLTVPLRPRAALAIDQMCFCERIRWFGDYVPLPDNPAFRPGDLVQVYAELRNFISEKHEQFFVTHLASSVEILDYNNNVVWRQDFPEDRNHPDRSRTPRHDYFNNYRFYMPQIPQGEYRLLIKVTDASRLPLRQAIGKCDFRVTTMGPRNGGG